MHAGPGAAAVGVDAAFRVLRPDGPTPNPGVRCELLVALRRKPPVVGAARRSLAEGR